MSMKDSGVEWIGEIPEDWELRKIKYILNERKEKNNPIETNFILSLSMERGVFPYSEKAGGGNKAKEDLTAYKIARPNDIVINSMNILAGSVGISKWIGAVSPVYYTYFSKDENINIYYYHYLFQCSEFQKSLLGLGNGIMMKETDSGKLNTIRMRIPSDKLGNLLFPIPTKIEQQKIADFLDSKIALIDQIIADTKRSIEELKAYKQSLITETVTKGLDPNVPMKDSGVDWIGEIPKGWENVPLRYLGQLQNGISKGGDFFGSGYPFVNYGDVYKNDIVEASGLIQSTETEQENYSVKRGDVFFTRTSETIDEVGISSVALEDIGSATFAGFLIRFRPSTNKLLPEYSKYYFTSFNVRQHFTGMMNMVIRASLGQELLKSLPVFIPTKTEQKRIVNFLDEKLKNLQEQIQYKINIISEYESYKKSLIYEYVTGKKQVK